MLPTDAHAVAAGRRVIEATPRPRAGDRLRRATRECLLAVDAVDAMLEDGGLTRADVTGDVSSYAYKSRFKRLLSGLDRQPEIAQGALAACRRISANLCVERTSPTTT